VVEVNAQQRGRRTESEHGELPDGRRFLPPLFVRLSAMYTWQDGSPKAVG